MNLKTFARENVVWMNLRRWYVEYADNIQQTDHNIIRNIGQVLQPSYKRPEYY